MTSDPPEESIDRRRRYYLEHRAEVIDKSRRQRLRLRAEDPERLKAWKRLSAARKRAADIEEARRVRREYVAARVQRDPAFAFHQRFSRAIRGAIQLGRDGWWWEAELGFTRADLVAHLEARFVEGMSWENRRAWHIDHVTPLSAFGGPEAGPEAWIKAWSITNLTPLWKAANLAKGAQRAP